MSGGCRDRSELKSKRTETVLISLAYTVVLPEIPVIRSETEKVSVTESRESNKTNAGSRKRITKKKDIWYDLL